MVKSDWMEAESRGWSSIDKVVCPRCVADPALQKVIRTQACSGKCDYCGKNSKVAPVEVLQEAVYSTVWTYYAEPTEAGVPWDEGSFIIESVDIEDVFDDLGLDGHQNLIADLVAADAGNGWVPAAEGHWASEHYHEIMLDSWASFAQLVKHKTRFHFGSVVETPDAGPHEVGPSRMLDVLTDRLRPYVRRLPKGTLVYRVRIRSPKEAWTPSPKELGAPAPEEATPGRMNPAGIPYLYASFGKATALREKNISDATVGAVFVAIFELIEPLIVIDLTRLPPLPSVFDLARKSEREQVLFARGFVQAISRPLAKRDHEQFEYAPSQVVCEYLSQVFRPGEGRMLGGLIFPSSVHPGGENLVIFPAERDLEQFQFGTQLKRVVRLKRS